MSSSKSIKIKKDVLYGSMLGILLLAPIVFSSVEVNVSVSVLFLAVLLIKKSAFTNHVYDAIYPLFLILFLGVILSLVYLNSALDIIKDIAYFSKPILFILVGYLLLAKLQNKKKLFEIIIYFGVLSALIHLFEVFTFLLDKPFIVNSIRNNCGLSNYLEMLTLIFLISNPKKYGLPLNIKYTTFIKVVVLASFIFYFSRTMFVGAVLFYLAINGYTKLSRKGLYYMTTFIILLLTFYTYLFSIDLERGSTGLEGFLYKMKLAPSEIFAPDKNIDIKNHKNLWDHWRAYEASKAITQLADTKYYSGLIFGKGFGALVDLGFEAPLGGERLQYISKIHNGYVFIMFKSGIIGLIFYFIFLINLYLFAYNKSNLPSKLFYNNLISAIALYFFFTSLIIGGIYNQGDILAIVLGGLFYMRRDIDFESKKTIS